METFEQLEAKGLARIQWVPDEERYDDSYLDTHGLSPEDLADERKELWRTIKRDGVWGLRGEFRLTPDGEWHAGPAVWGIIGQESDYEADIKADTAYEFSNYKPPTLCPHCGRS